MRTSIQLIATGVLFFLAGSSVLAAPPISEAIIPVDPAVTVRLVREALWNDICDLPAGDPHPWECTGTMPSLGGLRFGFDALGRFYELGFGKAPISNTEEALTFRRIHSDGSEEVLAYFLRLKCDYDPCDPWYSQWEYGYADAARFDVTNGKILLAFRSTRHTPQGWGDAAVGLVEISGFPKLLDTLLTFIPSGQDLALVAPAHPDAFPSADAFELWTGDAVSMPNWSLSQPLTCDAIPTPSETATITDTLADPPLGSVRYYLVASESGPDRRLGRQYQGGVFSAREPSTLPVCQ